MRWLQLPHTRFPHAAFAVILYHFFPIAFPIARSACCRPARHPRVSANPMNSLSYLSRQFDVLASVAIPSTPPSTPTGEARSPFEDGTSVTPAMRRSHTWTSARTFFFPATVQSRPEQEQRTLAPPPVRSRRRSGSTPNSLRRYQQTAPSRYNISSSTGVSQNTSQATQPTEPTPALAPAAEIFPSTSRIARNADKVAPAMRAEASYARKAILRVLFLLSSWFGTLWQGLVRSLGYAPRRRMFYQELEGEMDTSDEKDSDDDLSTALESRLKLASATRKSSKRTRTSSLLEYVLQPHFKPPTPSPLGKASALPTPTVNLIPPDGTEVDAMAPASPGSEDSSSSTSTLRLPTPPSSHSSQSSSAAAPPRITPLHTRKTLVLDLDETLIHSTTRPLNSSIGNSGLFDFSNLIGRNKKAGHMVEVVLNGRSTLYHVYKRPFADYFLRKVREPCLCSVQLVLNNISQVSAWYTLVIFTASMKEYADPVIDWLDAGRGILSHRFFREVRVLPLQVTD